MNTPNRLLWSSLIGIATLMPNQVIGQTTTTNCTEWYGDVRCTSRTRPNWGQALGQALTDAAERDRQKRLEDEQRQMLERQYRLLEAQLVAKEAARLSTDAAEKTRQEAQARLYWSRATSVLVGLADSLKFESDERLELAHKAAPILGDLLVTNPSASTFEIQDNLRPISNAISRNSQEVSDATIKWVQSNKSFLRAVSEKERWLVAEILIVERGDVISLTNAQEISTRITTQLNSAKAAIEQNRTFCIAGNVKCRREYLSIRTKVVADSMERVRSRRKVVAQQGGAPQKQEATPLLTAIENRINGYPENASANASSGGSGSDSAGANSPEGETEVTKWFQWEETVGSIKKCYYEYGSKEYTLTVGYHLSCPVSARFKVKK